MSLLFADNDPLAPKLGRRNPAFSPGEILQSQLQPSAGKDWFALSAPVGPDPAPNRREDVLKVQTLLGQAGHYDIKRTYGPTGWWGGLAQDRSTPCHAGDAVLNVNPSLKQIARADSRLQSKPLIGFDFRRPALGASRRSRISRNGTG